MPYIDMDRRYKIADGDTPKSSGELNFVITLAITQFLIDRGTNYQTMNDIVGALDNAKDEFRRRVQHPYEDEKCRLNGDVYN